MKNKLYALLVALAGTITVSAQNEFGIWASAINLSTDGGATKKFYNTNPLTGDANAIGTVNFSGSLGTFTAGETKLVVNGAELKTWKGTNANVCGGKVNYRIFPKGSTPSGSFSQIAVGFKCDCNTNVFADGLGACGARDQKWSTTDVNNAITLPTNPGVYVLEVYYEVSGQAGGTSQCSDTRYDSNNSANYSAEFTVNAPLPVRLLDFSGRKQTQGVELAWNTSSEENFKQFVVEHSSDGVNYVSAGTVLGKGNASSKAAYQFWHRQPVQGANYYRLRQVDRDGSFAYSKVVNVDWSGKLMLSVYPNPAKDLLYVSGLQKGDQIQIIDFSGKVLQTLSSAGESMNVNVRALPSGTYILRAGQKAQFSKSTFVKE
jgi:hypothetical protein